MIENQFEGEGELERAIAIVNECGIEDARRLARRRRTWRCRRSVAGG